jgi:hypothetical protein
MKYADGTSASSQHCDVCGGKGVSACAACKGTGRSKCSLCDGAKRVAQQCRACDGRGNADCRVCAEFAYRGDELAASSAARPGADGMPTPAAREAAVALCARAVERAGKFVRCAKDASDKAVAKLGTLPQAPAAGASAEERRACRERARATFSAHRETVSEVIGIWPTLVREQDALTRCEKALAALRASAPK